MFLKVWGECTSKWWKLYGACTPPPKQQEHLMILSIYIWERESLQRQVSLASSSSRRWSEVECYYLENWKQQHTQIVHAPDGTTELWSQCSWDQVAATKHEHWIRNRAGFFASIRILCVIFGVPTISSFPRRRRYWHEWLCQRRDEKVRNSWSSPLPSSRELWE
jgi:hypothetical protein